MTSLPLQHEGVSMNFEVKLKRVVYDQESPDDGGRFWSSACGLEGSGKLL
jgi:hypothetical protein